MRELTQKQHRRLDRIEDEEPDARITGWFASRKRGVSGPILSSETMPDRVINHTGYVVNR